MSTKASTFRDLLARGDAHLMFDARRRGVSVPSDMRGNASMQLKFALNIGIQDLQIDDFSGVSATLRFRTPAGVEEEIFVCVPWSAVFAIVDNQGRAAIWGSDVPIDVTLTTDKAPAGTVLGRPALRFGG